MRRIRLPDVGHDGRVRRRADGPVRDRVFELVDRARVVPDVGRGRRDRPPERTVGQRERAEGSAREGRHVSPPMPWSGPVRFGASEMSLATRHAERSGALTACATMLPFRPPEGNRLHRNRRGTALSESEGRQRLSGAQIVVEYLVRQRVPIVAGIPGHGSWSLTDALLDRQDAIRTVQVMHEQSAVHLADGFYRATGQPILAFTSIGPGATNTVIGMATAYVDSTAVALLTGSPHTYMRGAGLLQELERRHVADNPRIFEPVVKEWWQPSRVDELPFVLHRAWNQMLSGRPGPILLDLPMDVQADSAEVTLPDPAEREARGRVRPAAEDVERAAALLRGASRPVIVAGGGAILAKATEALTALAE